MTSSEALSYQTLRIIDANLNRIGEGLRLLEDLARLLLNDATLTQQLKTMRHGLVIIDTQALKGRSHIEVASQAIRGGAKTVQLRDKLRSKKELLPVAQQLRNLCIEHNVLFIINDYLDLALASDADGLHLGQDDLPIKVARKLLPMDKILGCSTTTVDQAITAESEGADYIAAGSIYPTSSKATAKVVGLERLLQIRQAISLPLVAIGGITKDNAAEVLAAGVDSVAVISAILQAESPEEAARQIAARFEV